ncbi:hypothetical protein DL771_009815 [Monosporascus sp. 5C6A]|nr:hypothetical protein DL771_009815 [Monosporascus sp. 5C6A]
MQIPRALRGSFRPRQERTVVSSTDNAHPRRNHLVRNDVHYHPSPWLESPMRCALSPISSIVPSNDGSATELVVASSTERLDNVGLGIVVNPQPDRRVHASRPSEHRDYSDDQASAASELSVIELDGENGDTANAGTHPKRILTAPPPSPRLPTVNPSSTGYPATHDHAEDGWHDSLEWRDFINSVRQGRDARYDGAENSYGYDWGFRQSAGYSQLFNKDDDDDCGGGNEDDLIMSWPQPPHDTLPRRPRIRHRHGPRAYLPQRTVGPRSTSDPACLVHGGSPLRQVMHSRDLVSVGGGAA